MVNWIPRFFALLKRLSAKVLSWRVLQPVQGEGFPLEAAEAAEVEEEPVPSDGDREIDLMGFLNLSDTKNKGKGATT